MLFTDSLIRHARCALLVAACLASSPVCVRAQTPPDTTVVLPEIRVEETRPADPTLEGSRVLTLDADALEATGARTTATLLEARSGLFIKQYGAGGLATVSLRGTNASQTLFLLDGVRLSDPQSGQLDLSLIPTSLLASVEVVHGAGAARYGTGSLGGTVRLRTIQASETPQVRVSGGMGAFGTKELGATLSGQRGSWSAIAAAETRQRQGDFSYLNTALVPVAEVAREGADQSATSLYGRIGHESEAQTISLAVWHSDTERGLPGPGNAPPGGARQWDDQTRLWLTHHQQIHHTAWHSTLAAHRTTTRFVNPTASADNTTQTHTLTLDTYTDVLLGNAWLLTAGAEAGYDHTDVEDGFQQQRLGVFTALTGTRGRWQLNPALRLDVQHSEAATFTALSPRLGLVVQPFTWDALRLKASGGRAFRAPTFAERFSQPGGNPALTPERGWSGDLGIHLQHRSLDAEVTAFALRNNDQIVWHPSAVSPGVQIWRPDNVARVVSRGIEVSVQATTNLRPARLEGGLFYTVTDAKNRGNANAASYKKQLRYVPREQLKLYASIGGRTVRLDLSGRFVSRRFLASDESTWLDPYQVFDAQLRLQYSLGTTSATLALGLQNLFDADYTIIRLYPMPPRHGHLRLTLDFHP